MVNVRFPESAGFSRSRRSFVSQSPRCLASELSSLVLDVRDFESEFGDVIASEFVREIAAMGLVGAGRKPESPNNAGLPAFGELVLMKLV